MLKLVPEPAPGRVYAGLDRALARLARGTRAHACRHQSRAMEWGAPLVVSIPVEGRGWLLMPISDLPPQGVPWNVLFRWLALITLGATAIAVFVANRMVRPLVLLEDAVESVGSDAMLLPVLPERGPAEVRATARALNSLSARLKSAMESRMRLVAAAGHDLRTPITRMRLRAEFVEDQEDRAAVAARPRRARAHRRQRDPSGARGIGQGAARADPARRAGRQHRLGAQGAESRRGERSCRACHRAGEPAHAQSCAAQPHDQCRDARRARPRQRRRNAKDRWRASSSRTKGRASRPS